jgi:hypothetical protein
LADNKKEYEIAYLWAHWDAQNMYIKMDPKWKAKVPKIVAKVISLNNQYNYKKTSVNINDNNKNENNIKNTKKGNFKCAPPDWVPIWAWLPAIICRLKSLLPPKIWIEWVCWSKKWAWWWAKKAAKEEWIPDDEFEEEEKKCQTDEDKNWIKDCVENKLKNAKLLLEANKDKYHFSQVW